jgi:acylphosphatase
MVFEGDTDAVEALVELSRTGPRGARIDRIEVAAETPEGLSGFSIS